MKAKFRYVQTKFWDDPFVMGLPQDKKFFYLFLFTNQFVQQCGVYEFSIRNFSHYSGFTEDQIAELLAFFVEQEKIIIVGGEIAVLNFQSNNNVRGYGKPVLDSIMASALRVKERRLLWPVFAKVDVTDRRKIVKHLNGIMPVPHVTSNVTWGVSWYVRWYVSFSKSGRLVKGLDYQEMPSENDQFIDFYKSSENQEDSPDFTLRTTLGSTSRTPLRGEKEKEKSLLNNNTDQPILNTGSEKRSFFAAAEKSMQIRQDRHLKLQLYLDGGFTCQEIETLLQTNLERMVMVGDLWKRPDDYLIHVFQTYFRETVAAGEEKSAGKINKDFIFWYKASEKQLERQYNDAKKDVEWFNEQLAAANGVCKKEELRQKFVAYYMTPTPSGKLYFQTLNNFDVKVFLKRWVDTDSKVLAKMNIPEGVTVLPGDGHSLEDIKSHYQQG